MLSREVRRLILTRNRIIAIVAAGAMLLGTGGVIAYAQSPRGRAERHPEINHAIRALQNAKKFLQKADRDFGGHRTKAVEDVDAALNECNQALQYDAH